MSESVFVQDDGFCLDGEVARAPGLYPRVTFKYRPAVPERSARFQNAASAAQQLEVGFDIVSKNVTDLRVDGEGDPISLNPESCKKLHTTLYATLLNHCLGLNLPKPLQEREGNSPGG